MNTAVFKAVFTDGSISSSGSATQTVNIDTYGPTFSGIAHSGSGVGPYSISPIPGQEGNASFSVTGTVSDDVAVLMTGTSTQATGLNVTLVGTSFSADAILQAGAQDSMVLTAVDRAGNSTLSSTIVTIYQNSLNTLAFTASSTMVGGGIVSNSGPFLLGQVGTFGAQITGAHQVITGAQGVFLKYEP